MRMTTLAVHIIAGGLGIILGFVALFAVKGLALHRQSGNMFVYAMLAMSLLGATIAAVWGVAPQSNVPAGLLTAYLVITGLTTVRPPPGWSPRLDIGVMLVAVAVGLANLSFALKTLGSPNTAVHWLAIPFLIFATLALLASAGDVRLIRAGGVHTIRGARRVARHLWRMSLALLIAAFSFFLGQAKIIPKPYRIVPLLMIPPLVVLAALLYWLWRVRIRQRLRGLSVRGDMPEIAANTPDHSVILVPTKMVAEF